uniref:Alpha 1,4-glycosyltransferase domain-containing protein n=1 Tax=Zooxanthella nutricula TaxID=1333877 RepID=A0A6U6MYF7_9DINO|mmetsp:Transcript_43937/g.133059  ORF Transcript_43937/g.133059 Transcript_43937/m.133059 type:complete len:413 (+) Transcript_43937:80-1318(+)
MLAPPAVVARLGAPVRQLCLLCTLVAFVLIVLLLEEESFGFSGDEPVAYHKYSALVWLITRGSGIHSDDARPMFRADAATPIHLIFASKECVQSLAPEYHCMVESMLRQFGYDGEASVDGGLRLKPAPGGPPLRSSSPPPSPRQLILWNFVPDDVTCEGSRSFPVGPFKNVTIKTLRIDIDGESPFGKWYHSGANGKDMWSVGGGVMWVLNDFARLYVLSVYGGMYLDMDFLVLDKKLMHVQNGVTISSSDPTGAHRLNNAVMRVPRNSTFLQYAFEDWATHFHAFRASGFSWYGFSGPALTTRTWVKYQAAITARRNFPDDAFTLLNPNLTQPFQTSNGDCASLVDLVSKGKAVAIHLENRITRPLRSRKFSELPPCIYNYLAGACPTTSRDWPPLAAAGPASVVPPHGHK